MLINRTPLVQARYSVAACCLVLLLTSVVWSQAPEARTIGPIRYHSDTRSKPRPLRSHVLKIDLHARQYELAVSAGRDPDDEGPIEALLTPPNQLAANARLIAAVNTNPWKMISKGVGYIVDAESNISGWVKSNNKVHSNPEQANWSFWVSEDGRAHISQLSKPVQADVAVAGFGGLLKQGKILPAPSDVLHPRTALGLDPTGRWLTLLVVDGRQKGYSEGVSLRELAVMMQKLGCSDALNLDGGGSTIMLLQGENGDRKTVNRPSGILGPRPIPVMLGVRRK